MAESKTEMVKKSKWRDVILVTIYTLFNYDNKPKINQTLNIFK